MKKVRLMLSIVVLFAVVAGAFAFKAKKSVNFCVRTTTIGTGLCTAQLDGIKTTLTGTQDFYTTLTNPNIPCAQLTCKTAVKLEEEPAE